MLYGQTNKMREAQHENRGGLGSPRPSGNSASLAQKFLDEARTLGAETRSFLLNQLDFTGCQGCRACKTKSDRCVLSDDLAEVLAAVKEADVLLLASPVYFWDLSGQLKCFFDRLFLRNPDFPARLMGKGSYGPGQPLPSASMTSFPLRALAQDVRLLFTAPGHGFAGAEDLGNSRLPTRGGPGVVGP
jgi:NAD(P)H-dependent FMN reductase